MLGQCRQALFGEALQAVLQKHAQRSLEPRLLRQLLQAAALARAQGVPAALPEAVAKTAGKWWGTTANKVPSLSHVGVSGLLKSMGVEHTVMVTLGAGLPTVDIAIDGEHPVAIQVCQLLHCAMLNGAMFARSKCHQAGVYLCSMT